MNPGRALRRYSVRHSEAAHGDPTQQMLVFALAYSFLIVIAVIGFMWT